MAAETPSKDQPFRILDYYFAVVDEEPIYIIDQTQQQYAVTKPGPPKQPALALTCKQIRDEVLPVFNGENTFVYNPDGGVVQYNRSTISAWIQAREPYIPLIKSVGVAAYREVFEIVNEEDDPEHYEKMNAENRELLEDFWMSDHPLDQEEMAEIAQKKAAKGTTHEGTEFDDSDPVTQMVSLEYIITATIPGASDEVEVWLGGALENQCVCNLREGDWNTVISGPRAGFIKYAMQYCRDELNARMYLTDSCTFSATTTTTLSMNLSWNNDGRQHTYEADSTSAKANVPERRG